MVSADPPLLAMGLMRRPDGTHKDTAANILETGEFVVHLVSQADAPLMNFTAIDAPPGFDEAAHAGLDLVPSSLVAPPRIASAPVAMECRLFQATEAGKTTVVLGQVLRFHIADRFVDPARLHVDTMAMDLVARMHGRGWYARNDASLQFERPDFAAWQAGHPPENEPLSSDASLKQGHTASSWIFPAQSTGCIRPCVTTSAIWSPIARCPDRPCPIWGRSCSSTTMGRRSMCAQPGLPFRPHPHRGFETVTFILEGELTHRDTGGHESTIYAGGVQWMTAGSGLIHAEISSEDFKRKGGPLEILQLWVNLPARLKMTTPRYVGVQADQVPVLVEDEGRAKVHLVSGTRGG
jgi:flavin reductase (DIM6/NTAB) family NADH-FMN oxidoreductase RutF